jgi:hypothetical protein
MILTCILVTTHQYTFGYLGVYFQINILIEVIRVSVKLKCCCYDKEEHCVYRRGNTSRLAGWYGADRLPPGAACVYRRNIDAPHKLY